MKPLLQTLFLSLLLIQAGLAQVGKVGINTTTPAAMLHVKDSSVVFTGPYPLPAVPGSPPVAGGGTRMMWFPSKAAFRAGTVDETEWDQSNIGKYSFAAGLRSIATGQSSTSFGSDCFAFANNSFTAGTSSVTLGVGSQAFGQLSVTKGNYALACGTSTMAKSFACVVLGRYNDTTSTSSVSWASTDPVFIVGNGSSESNRSNALTVLKNGKIGIEMIQPGFPLNFASALGDKISLWGNTGPHYGFGIQSNLLQIHTDVVNSDIAFGYGTSAAFTERMRIKGNGNVGIANNDPGYKLDVTGRIRLRQGSDGSPGIWFNKSDNSVPISFLGMYNDEYVGIYGAQGSSWNFVMSTITGRVGIGLQSPLQKFHVNGSGLFNGTVMAVKAASGATPNGNAVGIFENNTTAYLNLLTPNANDSGILFGNPTSAAHGGLYYNTTNVPNGFQFRTNGNVIRMALTNVGYLGLGTNTPISHLHVRSANPGVTPAEPGVATFETNENTYINLSAPADHSSGIWFNHPSPAESGAILYNQGNVEDGFRFQVGTNTVAMVINDFGWVGIGTSIPEASLDVVGSGSFGGTVTASCGVLSCSDIRYKKNILPLTNALSSIQMLKGVYYHWDKENFPDIEFTDDRQVGIIAQELEKVFPEIVDTDSHGYKTVDYSRLSPVLLEAIKEQQQIIDAQNTRLDHLQQQIDLLLTELKNVREACRTNN